MLIREGVCEITLNVNGEARALSARPADTLLYALRDKLGLTGAKPGCENGDCGACTVVMDGMPVKSCLVLAAEAEGRDILTVEGLDNTPLQRAFIANQAFQCGYCTSGFLMAAHALMNRLPGANEYQMETWLESNICRCTSYSEIRAALAELMPSTAQPSEPAANA